MGERTWPQLISALLRSEDLSTGDTAWAMDEVMSGNATAVQIAAFAIALRAKGESAAEIRGLADAMLDHATLVELSDDLRSDVVDIVGTGGDQAHTVNISTMSALVVAGAGLRVAKHGNRAATSICGAADLLEFLGVPLDLSAEAVGACVREVGIGFCFAPVFHSGFRHTSVPRREMGVPTAFNFLGPLTNPARPRSGVVGCADARMAPVLADVFAGRGDSVLVLRGEDGLDEFTTAAPTRIWAASDGGVRETVIDAVDLGLARSAPGDLRGGDATYNGGVARAVLAGQTGPVHDAVVLNAGSAIAARSGFGTTDDELHAALRDGIERARIAIASGAAADGLDRWVSYATSQRSK